MNLVKFAVLAVAALLTAELLSPTSGGRRMSEPPPSRRSRGPARPDPPVGLHLHVTEAATARASGAGRSIAYPLDPPKTGSPPPRHLTCARGRTPRS